MSSMLNPAFSRPRIFELTSEEWALLFAAALLTVAGIAAVSPDVTTWSAFGLGFTALVVGHLCMTARRFVAFPDLIVAASCLQWIIAPWLAAKYPSRMVVYHMTLPIDEYLRYAVPATIALWVGLHLPATRMVSTTWVLPETEQLSKPLKRTLDAAIVIGLIADVYSDYVPNQLAFLGYLIASLRFVGALGWMITKTPGWMIRVLGVMLHFVATQSAGGGMFYLVVHWGGYFLLVYGFMKRWRMTMAMALIAGIMGLGLLQTVKPTFRDSLIEERPSGPVEAFTRLTSMLWERRQPGSRHRSRRRHRRHAGTVQSRLDHRAHHDARASGGTVRDGPDPDGCGDLHGSCRVFSSRVSGKARRQSCSSGSQASSCRPIPAWGSGSSGSFMPISARWVVCWRPFSMAA